MTTELTTGIDIRQEIVFGRRVLAEIKTIVRNRKDKVVINGKQYLEFCDWQLIGVPFGITAATVETKEIWNETLPKDYDGQKVTFKKLIGFTARAAAMKDGKEISFAEAQCTIEEANWQSKPIFTLRSMAQTRACSKVLRNVLQWVVKLPDEHGKPIADEFAPEAAEEM